MAFHVVHTTIVGTRFFKVVNSARSGVLLVSVTTGSPTVVSLTIGVAVPMAGITTVP